MHRQLSSSIIMLFIIRSNVKSLIFQKLQFIISTRYSHTGDWEIWPSSNYTLMRAWNMKRVVNMEEITSLRCKSFVVCANIVCNVYCANCLFLDTIFNDHPEWWYWRFNTNNSIESQKYILIKYTKLQTSLRILKLYRTSHLGDLMVNVDLIKLVELP